LWNLFLLSTELNLLPLLVVCILVAVGKEFLQFLAALRHKQGAVTLAGCPVVALNSFDK
jgi:hypothetical protein